MQPVSTVNIATFRTVIGIFGLLLAGQSLAADFVSVCDRQAPFKEFLTSTLNKTCEQLTAADLAAVTRVAVPDSGLTTFNPADVANLPNLEILNITRNAYTALPPAAFVDLPKLKTLVLFGTRLAALPDDFLTGNPLIENLHIFDNPFTTIPPAALDRIEHLANLKVLDLSDVLNQQVKDQLRAKFPDNGPVELTFY
jgi:Leucine-rich repeat (LRR) protein